MKQKIIWVLSVLALVLNCFAEERNRPCLAVFDEEVAVCRRVVRQSCALLQEMISRPSMDQQKKDQVLKLLAEARKQWARIQSTYSHNPPQEYARDATFPHRLQDIANALEDMERAMINSDARRSFSACGYGCGLFVKMHIDNGLSYVLDTLFSLRQTAKTTEALMKTRGLESIRKMLLPLMEQRDRVLASGLPWPEPDERNQSYLEAVKEMSRTVDELSLAVSSGQQGDVTQIISNLLILINKAYGLAL